MDTVTMTELEGIAILAAKARQDGVRLYRDRRDGRHYASSSTMPGKHYYVTLASCQCPGFLHHQRCKHWAALHIATILEDGAPDPSPLTEAPHPPVTCGECQGAGTVPATISTGPRSWAYTNETCPSCHGTGAALDTAA